MSLVNHIDFDVKIPHRRRKGQYVKYDDKIIVTETERKLGVLVTLELIGTNLRDADINAEELEIIPTSEDFNVSTNLKSIRILSDKKIRIVLDVVTTSPKFKLKDILAILIFAALVAFMVWAVWASTT